MFLTKSKKIAKAIFLLAGTLQLSFCLANSNISVTTKNPDPNTGNQSWFNFEEPAGGSAKDTLIVRNNGDQEQSIKLYPTDAYTNETGSFSLKDSSEEQKGIGAWAKIEQENITLKPAEEKEIDFIINIPKESPPGQYFGAIVKEEDNKDCANNSCQGNISIRTRTGNRIYLSIPGEKIEKINLLKTTQKVTNDSLELHFFINNQGNIGYEPKATVDFYNIFGQKIDSIQMSLGKSFPNSTIEPIVSWKYNNNFGPIKAIAHLAYIQIDQGNWNNLKGSPLSENVEIRSIIMPWIYIFIFLIVLTSSISIHYIQIHQYRKILKNAINYKIRNNESLEDIAQKAATKWQIIAKINNLKAPYIVKEGQVIRVPKNK